VLVDRSGLGGSMTPELVGAAAGLLAQILSGQVPLTVPHHGLGLKSFTKQPNRSSPASPSTIGS
jgi:hypothetical protein